MLIITKIDDIRKAFFEEGISISEISRKHKQATDRKTVRKYIAKDDSYVCEQKTITKIEQPKLTLYKEIIYGQLEDDIHCLRQLITILMQIMILSYQIKTAQLMSFFKSCLLNKG